MSPTPSSSRVLAFGLLLAAACSQSSSSSATPTAAEVQDSGDDATDSGGPEGGTTGDGGSGVGSAEAGDGGLEDAVPSRPEGGQAPSDAATGAADSESGIDDGGLPCVTSAAKGTCGPYLYPAITGSNGNNTTVGQDVWNPISGWSQTLYATSPGSWYVRANLPAGNTAVVSFPNTGESYGTNLLSSFTSIYSSFAESMNSTSGTSAEAAYDIWLNDWNNEVMIQHDMYNRGGPCGPVLHTVSFGGTGGVPQQSWILCQYGSELIWQIQGNGSNYGVHKGSVDVLAMLEWLENNGGYLPQASTLTAIGYGFEICSTGGADERFEVSAFSIRSKP
ncbi:MAG: GH12 family glycosyl hydrolase domain-containing protein [Polyangiaceae bacterium]